MKRILKINPLVGYGLVLLITTTLILYGVKVLRDREAAGNWITQSNAVLATADQALLGVASMETGFRGYMLTGQEDFLDPYNIGKAEFEAAIQNLMELSVDDPAKEARWKEVQVRVAEWEAGWVTRGFEIRRDINDGKAPLDMASDYVRSGGGKLQTDTIREIISAGKQAEVDLLNERLQAGQRASQSVYRILVGGMVLALTIGLLSGILLSRANARNRENIEIQRLLLEEREKERMEIARNLHDGPIQDLVSMMYILQGLAANPLDTKSAKDVDSVKDTVRKVMKDLRGYAMELRSPVLAEFGLEKAIQSHIEAFHQQHPEMDISFQAQEAGEPLPAASRDTLYRIFQETMNNIVRHSQASQVNILFQRLDEKAVLELRDNGIGFEQPSDWLSLARHGHLGLVGIRERADAIGGQVEIITSPGSGTCIKVSAPVR